MTEDMLPLADRQATANVLRELLATLQGYYAHHRLRANFGIEDANPNILDEVGELVEIVSAWHQEFLEGRFRLLLNGETQAGDQLVQFTQSLMRVIFVWESSTISSVETIFEKEGATNFTLERYLVACYVWPLYRYENRAKLGQAYLERYPDIQLAEAGDEAHKIGGEAINVANSLAHEFAQDEESVSPERRKQVADSLREHLSTLYDLMLESLLAVAHEIGYDLVETVLGEEKELPTDEHG